MVFLHDQFARDRILEIADGVLGLNLDQFLLDMFVLAAVTFDLMFVGLSDIGLAEDHQVVDVIAGVEQETAHGGVRHLVGNQGYGA